MLRIIKWIGVPALAVALLAGLDAPKAEAGNGFSLRIGGFGISTGNYGYRTFVRQRGYYPHSGYNSFYGARNHGARNHGARSHGAGNHRGGHYGHGRSFHDTTHLDYHPTEVIRHGNHYDVQPGHYDVHRSGHWHR